MTAVKQILLQWTITATKTVYVDNYVTRGVVLYRLDEKYFLLSQPIKKRYTVSKGKLLKRIVAVFVKVNVYFYIIFYLFIFFSRNICICLSMLKTGVQFLLQCREYLKRVTMCNLKLYLWVRCVSERLVNYIQMYISLYRIYKMLIKKLIE